MDPKIEAKVLASDRVKEEINEILDGILDFGGSKKKAMALKRKIEEAIKQIRCFPKSCPKAGNDLTPPSNLRKKIIDGYAMYYLYMESDNLVVVVFFMSLKGNEEAALRRYGGYDGD